LVKNVKNRRAAQNYFRPKAKLFLWESGAPGGTRTLDLLVRSLAPRPRDNLVAFIDQVHVEVAKSQEVLFRHAPSLNSDTSLNELEKTALEIPAHLREKGKRRRNSNYGRAASTIVASSRYRQRAFPSCIWRGLRQSGSNKLGLPTTITVDIARDVATFSRFRLYRNSIPLGASSGDEVVRE
jgi:hypothetical protein